MSAANRNHEWAVVIALLLAAACGGTPQAPSRTAPTIDGRTHEPEPKSGSIDDAGGIRLAQGSDFELEFVSAYYDRTWNRRGGLVARFRFRNKTTSSVPIHTVFPTHDGDDGNDPTKVAVVSRCSLLQIGDRGPIVNEKHASCDWTSVELLPGIAYTIDVPVFVPIGENEADRSAKVLITGPGVAIASGTFAPRALLDALPSNRRYPENGDLPIVPENRFVMDFKAVKKEWARGGDRLTAKAYFKPTEEQILATNRAILKYLLSAPSVEQRNLVNVSEDDRKRIVDLLDQYCVQYWGTAANLTKARGVFANFFLCPKRDLENKRPNRSSEIVDVRGGGADFWCGEFDITSRKLTSVWVNAPE